MNDKILVRLVDISKDCSIETFYTTNFSETLKMYSFLKENELNYEITIARDDEYPSQYEDKTFFIKDIGIQFGSNVGLHSIDVYVEVF